MKERKEKTMCEEIESHEREWEERKSWALVFLSFSKENTKQHFVVFGNFLFYLTLFLKNFLGIMP